MSTTTRSAASYAADLANYEDRFGPLMTGENLWRTLGYPSSTAFAQARRRGRLPISVFQVKNRRGYFGFTADVVGWIRSLNPAGDEGRLTEETPMT